MSQNCTVQNPDFFDFLRRIVNGSITVVESAAELNLPPEAMRATAMEVLLLGDPEFPRPPDGS